MAPRARKPRSKKMYKKKLAYKKKTFKKINNGFPSKKIIVCKYCTTIILGSASHPAPIDSYTFRTNSYYDPDFTGGGHQPMGHDQWAILYEKYKVLKSRIKVTFSANQGSQNAIVGIEGTSDVDAETNVSTLKERTDTVLKVITTQLPKTCVKSFSAKKAFVSDDADTALMSANPVESDYFRIFVSSCDTLTNLVAGSISAQVELDYQVLLYSPAIISAS